MFFTASDSVCEVQIGNIRQVVIVRIPCSTGSGIPSELPQSCKNRFDELGKRATDGCQVDRRTHRGAKTTTSDCHASTNITSNE